MFPDRQTARVILLRHIDAKWKDDLSDLPEACRNENPPLQTPQEVMERIGEIPTRFWLSSECDRQLLVTAAGKVVAQNRQDILERWRLRRLRGPGEVSTGGARRRGGERRWGEGR